ncbi:hypothetical protein V1514DRAFT_302174 [Lipomyces japonicus]|uniref:uncharacterized protein n=1 Tax=Lipomyces japonicus TaxID=56871 RepID=UPI0034D01B99
MTTTITPPSLSYFCIFNPTFCHSDDTLNDQIFFYTSRADNVSLDEQLRKVGLIQGIISFASDFSNQKPVEIIDTKKTRTVIVEIEPNWWIIACINFTRVQSQGQANATTITNQDLQSNSSKKDNSTGAFASLRRKKKIIETKTEYSRREVPGYGVIHSHLVRGYNQWKLLHGNFPASLAAKQQSSPRTNHEQDEHDTDNNVDMSEFKFDLAKFWSWWLHKWELYIFSTATWNGTLNNSFLISNLQLGQVPTLSFSFMDAANGIKQSPGKLSAATVDAINAMIKKEEQNGMVDLIITRINNFSMIANGVSLSRSGATSIADGNKSWNRDNGSIYDDAYSIRSSSSSLFGTKEKKKKLNGKINDDAITTADEAKALINAILDDEAQNGCVFQGAGYISKSSVAEYSRWLIDNHIFPSPSSVEGIKWPNYANKDEPVLPFEAIVFAFKHGYVRPRPAMIRNNSGKLGSNLSRDKKRIITSLTSTNNLVVPNSDAVSVRSTTSERNLAKAIEQVRDSSLALLHKVTSNSSTMNTFAKGNKDRLIPDIRDDLSDARFLVGYQGEVDGDLFEDDDDDDDEDEDGQDQEFERHGQPIISDKEVFIIKKRKKHRHKRVDSISTADDGTDVSTPPSPEKFITNGKHEEDLIPLPPPTTTTTTQKPAMERLRLVVYKRAPFMFSAFFDPIKADNILSSLEYYKNLHLRLGTLVEPIMDDLQACLD